MTAQGFRNLIRHTRTMAAGAAMLLGAGLGMRPAVAEEPVKVIMPLWGPTIKADGTGMFVDLFRFALRGHEADYQLDFVSYDEALRLLVFSDADCAFPISKRALMVSVKHMDPDSLAESLPILVSKTFLFSRPGAPIISSETEMKDKLLIQIRGENYNHNFKTAQARFWNVDSEVDKVKVLLEGRGDAMLGSMPDILFSFRELGVDIPPYDPAFSVLDYNNAMTCRIMPKTKALIEHFDSSVRAALADGSLRASAVKHGIPDAVIAPFLPTVQDK